MKVRTGLLLLALPLVTAAQDNRLQMFFDRMDADRDGKISLEEFQKPAVDNFRQIDANGDGGIDMAEVEAFGGMMRRRMQQMRQQGSGMPSGR